MRRVYFDYVTTTPADPRVVEAMLPFFTETFGNPAAHLHEYGLKAKNAVEEARVKVAELGVDALSMVGHAFYGPKGVGALYLREGVDIVPILKGGAQEGGRRPGTDNVPAIVGMGKAAELARLEMKSRIEHLIPLRDKLIHELPNRLKYFHFTGHTLKRLPGHVSFWISFAEGETLVLFLNYHGIAVASGSACSSPDLKASHVLTAIGVPPDVCHGSITVSLGKDNTDEDVDFFLDTLPKVVERGWHMSPLYEDE